MTAKQQWQVVAAIVVLLAGGAFAATHFLKDELTAVTIGSDAPTFEAMTLDGTHTKKTLANYKHEVVVLNIWATWCGPCREEMPSIQKLHERPVAPWSMRLAFWERTCPNSAAATRMSCSPGKTPRNCLTG